MRARYDPDANDGSALVWGSGVPVASRSGGWAEGAADGALALDEALGCADRAETEGIEESPVASVATTCADARAGTGS